MNNPDLYQTISEVLPPEQATVLHALITARYRVLPREDCSENEKLAVYLFLVGAGKKTTKKKRR